MSLFDVSGFEYSKQNNLKPADNSLFLSLWQVYRSFWRVFVLATLFKFAKNDIALSSLQTLVLLRKARLNLIYEHSERFCKLIVQGRYIMKCVVAIEFIFKIITNGYIDLFPRKFSEMSLYVRIILIVKYKKL